MADRMNGLDPIGAAADAATLAVKDDLVSPLLQLRFRLQLLLRVLCASVLFRILRHLESVLSFATGNPRTIELLPGISKMSLEFLRIWITFNFLVLTPPWKINSCVLLKLELRTERTSKSGLSTFYVASRRVSLQSSFAPY